MKRLIGMLALIALLIIAVPHFASAHVLKTDGSIGGVLHIAPDDNPKSGVLINYEVEFNDTQSLFKLEHCSCTATLQENGKTLSSAPLTVTGPQNSINTITFPSADVYTLQITGKPKDVGSFSPFELDYLVRVEAGESTASTTNSINQKFPPLLALGLVLLIALIVLGAYKSSRNTSKSATKE
jgi:hypothetical protein